MTKTHFSKENNVVKQLTLSEFKLIFDNHYSSLCLFANRYLKNLDISKDIVQEVYIKIWEKKQEFNNIDTIKSFLYTSVKNKSIDYIKSNHFKKIELFSDGDMENLEKDSFFVSEVVISEVSSIIQKAIDTLPKKCAEIIRLSLMNLSNSEISEKLDISINTVKAQKKIAYKKLKPILKEFFFYISFIFKKN